MGTRAWRHRVKRRINCRHGRTCLFVLQRIGTATVPYVCTAKYVQQSMLLWRSSPAPAHARGRELPAGARGDAGPRPDASKHYVALIGPWCRSACVACRLDDMADTEPCPCSPAGFLHWSQRYHANEPTTMQTTMPPATKGKQADLGKSSPAGQLLLLILLHNKGFHKGPRTQHNAQPRTQRSSTQPLVSGTQQPRTLTPSTQRPLPRSNVTRRLPSRRHAASSETCCEK
jgi:hypothetical protein